MSESPQTGAFPAPAPRSSTPTIISIVIGLVVIGAALIMVATNQSSSAENSAQTYANSQAITDKLRDAGIQCADFEPQDAGSVARDRAACTVGNTKVSVSVYADYEGVRGEMVAHREFNKSISGMVDVAGPNWLVDVGQDKALAGEVAEALGGGVVDFDELGDDPLPDFSA